MTLHLQLTADQQKELTDLAAQFNQELEDRNTPPFPKATTLRELKEKLKAALFAQEGFAALWQQAQTHAGFLCLSHEETAVRNLPWQIATEEQPLLAVAKSFKKSLPPHRPSVGFPLKVLIMVASPEGVTRLAYEDEELQLLQAFSPLMAQGLAQVHFTDDGSLGNLEEKLEENKYHILHFTGHGSYRDGKGTLALEDPVSGKLKEASAGEFNQVLARVGRKGHRPVLVVLSACQTAQGVAAGDLSGVADTLMQGGMPAVIAMSASILDNCASHFAATLYTQLSGEFNLSDAFQDARLAVKNFEIQIFDFSNSGLAPGQWLIPQLLLNEQVAELVDKNSPKEVLDFKHDVKYIKGEKALVDLRVRPDNYVFVGRRKEKRIAMQQLKDGQSILLRGQGGVGKTALAEHLAIRLLAGNQRIKVFTFSEKTPTAQHLLDQLQNYLTKEKKDFKIVSELPLIPKQTDQFFHLLGRISEKCDPVFLFDNIESFQKFDTEKQLWVWHQEKHEDVFQLMQILDKSTPFPLIITGRYPIAEFPELAICNMNTVPFSDFFRKCHQLGFIELSQKMRTGALSNATLKRTDNGQPPTFEDIVRLLHKTFGGNYRALEFFDELYAQKGAEIFGTLEELSKIEERLEEQEIKAGVLTRMSENLIFAELLTYLNELDKDSLFVLAQFNIPVLPMAVGWQRNNEDRTASLLKAVNLTLAERQMGTDGRERFYVMPLVRDLLAAAGVTFAFDEQVAGDYHNYVVVEKISEDALAELSEVFERYFLAGAVEDLNDVGWRLCKFYYNIQQFRFVACLWAADGGGCQRKNVW
ncbi:MAG: CHAT domain-containing protein [Saprospiraceae bacterium]